MATETDLGFAYRMGRDGAVTIHRHGRLVTTLRGSAAQSFLADVDGAPGEVQQQAMARATGNYKRGNEKMAALHPRNGGRGR